MNSMWLIMRATQTPSHDTGLQSGLESIVYSVAYDVYPSLSPFGITFVNVLHIEVSGLSDGF